MRWNMDATLVVATLIFVRDAFGQASYGKLSRIEILGTICEVLKCV